MYFLRQHKVRLIAKGVLIKDFNLNSNLAGIVSKTAQLEPLPKWLQWFRIQKIKFSNLIHDGDYSLR